MSDAQTLNSNLLPPVMSSEDLLSCRIGARVQGTGEYFPPFQYHGEIVKVEIDGVAIYRPFGEFRRANSYCHLYGAHGLGQRQAYF
ncbi:uncharacterized protein TNCV_1578361 [Trichonephila clavipes]|nr:uncharacterized protein TNCV_1578361 [Trichonephila clavipes]